MKKKKSSASEMKLLRAQLRHLQKRCAVLISNTERLKKEKSLLLADVNALTIDNGRFIDLGREAHVNYQNAAKLRDSLRADNDCLRLEVDKQRRRINQLEHDLFTARPELAGGLEETEDGDL